jgi:hypothetical protein
MEEELAQEKTCLASSKEEIRHLDDKLVDSK